jgi:hypothetical protein
MKPFPLKHGPFKFVSLFGIFFLLNVVAAGSELMVASSIRYGGWGFNTTRSSTDTGFNRLALDELSFSVTFPFVKSSYLEGGYRYSTLLESQIFLHLLYSLEKIDIEAGLQLGFQNDLPITFVPGVYGKLQVMLKKHFLIGLQGHTSVFIHPLVSLSPGGADFDQNLLGLTGSFLTGDAILSLFFKNENIYLEPSSTTSKRNGKKSYGISISTNLEDFWLNSHTAFGGDIRDFTEGSVQHRLIAFYIEETLILSLKRFDISTGLKCDISYTPLKGVSSESPPQAPSFSVFGELRWKKQ